MNRFTRSGLAEILAESKWWLNSPLLKKMLIAHPVINQEIVRQWRKLG